MYIRIDPQVKADVEAIYSRYGMSLTDAINIFLHESRNLGGLPFDLRWGGLPQEKEDKKNPHSAMGMLHEYANPALIPLEEEIS
jgi:addiction module RelB/DinJ family antitoxin